MPERVEAEVAQTKIVEEIVDNRQQHQRCRGSTKDRSSGGRMENRSGRGVLMEDKSRSGGKEGGGAEVVASEREKVAERGEAAALIQWVLLLSLLSISNPRSFYSSAVPSCLPYNV